MEKANQIFDNYEVDCNTCESYWNSQCDGVKINDRRNCTSYKATREINVVEELAKCKKDIERLWRSDLVIKVVIIAYLLKEILVSCLT